jgi:GntR family transcriptional regulator of abcA and norABC
MNGGLELLVVRGDKPLHLQIADQIQERILSGSLSVGSRLPTVRSLAATAGVSRVTALQAYEALQVRGLIESRVGSGTYVAPPQTREGGRGRLRAFKPCSVSSDFSASARASGITNFAIGDADERLFHADEFAAGMLRARAVSGETNGAYGDGALLTALASYYRGFGIRAEPESLVVTGGGIATNAALAMTLGAKGAKVVLQDPAFPHAFDYFQSFNLDVVGVPTVKGDLDVQRFEDELRKGEVRAAFLFLTVNQCTGESASLRNKRDVLALCEKYGVHVFEDASAFWTVGPKGRTPNLWELSDGMTTGVVSFDCMTKTLGRSVPISCAFTNGRIKDSLTVRAMGLGSSPPSMMQHALRAFIESRAMASHISRSFVRHTTRRQAVLSALREHAPLGCSWTEPSVGHSIWITLPPHIDETQLYEKALAAGVAVAPGIAASVPRRPVAAVRLSYGASSVDEITSGIARFSRVVGQA